jgi:hypothetical protein
LSEERLPSLSERLAALAAFVPVFEATGFSFGDWQVDPGQMPWFRLSEEGLRFVRTCSEYGWVSPRVNWVEWKDTSGTRRFADDVGAVASASVHDLEALLTTFVRQDRFVEGELASAFEAGYLSAIVRRAKQLHSEIREGGT